MALDTDSDTFPAYDTEQCSFCGYAFSDPKPFGTVDDRIICGGCREDGLNL